MTASNLSQDFLSSLLMILYRKYAWSASSYYLINTPFVVKCSTPVSVSLH